MARYRMGYGMALVCASHVPSYKCAWASHALSPKWGNEHVWLQRVAWVIAWHWRVCCMPHGINMLGRHMPYHLGKVVSIGDRKASHGVWHCNGMCVAYPSPSLGSVRLLSGCNMDQIQDPILAHEYGSRLIVYNFNLPIKLPLPQKHHIWFISLLRWILYL